MELLELFILAPRQGDPEAPLFYTKTEKKVRISGLYMRSLVASRT